MKTVIKILISKPYFAWIGLAIIIYRGIRATQTHTYPTLSNDC